MCKYNTCLVSIVLSILIAIASSIAFYVGALSEVIALVIISLILALVSIMSFILVKGYRDNWCLCNNGMCLITGIAGTILFGTIALTITLTVGAVFSAIIIALVGFFAGLTLTSLITLLYCVSKSTCNYKEC